MSFFNTQYANSDNCDLQAESAAPHDPVYPSNLSAALYELGDYSACFEAICRAVANVSSSKDDHSSLLLRLATRLAKTLSHGLRNGAINKSMIERENLAVEQLKSLSKSSDPKSELSSAWAQWRRVESEVVLVLAGVDDAKSRLTQLPLYRNIL
jgi:hypothetical protein